MRLPRAWTDADGAPSAASEPDAVFSVDAIRALLEIVEALHRRGVIDAGSGVGTHFPHFMIAISRHGHGLCLEAEGGGRDPHEGEELLVERPEFGLEHLHEAVALA